MIYLQHFNRVLTVKLSMTSVPLAIVVASSFCTTSMTISRTQYQSFIIKCLMVPVKIHSACPRKLGRSNIFAAKVL